MDVNAAGELIAGWAGKYPLISRVFVFGSRVRGTPRADSDIDIAIELDMSLAHGCESANAAWIYECQETGMAEQWRGELSALLSLVVDLQQYRGVDTPVIERGVTQSGLLVYAKN